MRSLTIPSTAQPWVARLVRLGYFAKGVIYTLIGLLAMRVALGLRGGRLTDPRGVLLQILQQPFGKAMLAIIGVGIIAYAAYYVFEAVADLRRKGGGVRGWLNRSLTIIKAVFYGAVGVQAMAIVWIGNSPRSDPEDQARTVMDFPLGWVLLVLIGAGVAVYGVTQVKLAWHARPEDDIDAARVQREARWVLPLGRAGTGARGIVLLMMGTGLALAGAREKPSDADGYREIMLAMLAINPLLLAALGAGLLCFGLYQLCHARYARLPLRS